MLSHALVGQAEDAGSPDPLVVNDVDLVLGRLYTLWVENTTNNAIAGVTSPNETWEFITDVSIGGNTRLSVYRCEATGNRTDEDITIDWAGAQTGASALVIETQGQVQGSNGAAAIQQFDETNGLSGTTGQLTLPSALQTDSHALAAFCYSLNEAADAAGDSVELGNEFHATPTRGIIVVSDDDNVLNYSTTGSAGAAGAVGIEVLADAGGGTPQELEAVGTSVSSGSATLSVPKNLTASGTSLSGGAGDLSGAVLLLAVGVSLTAGVAALSVSKLLTASGVSLSRGLAQLSVGAGGAVRLLRLLLRVGR